MPEAGSHNFSLGNAIPNELTEILKQEFNTGIPQLATLGGIIGGTFGQKDFFDAAVWTIVSVATFLVVFLFQRQIPSSVPRTTVYVLIILGIISLLFFGVYHYSKPSQPSDTSYKTWLHESGSFVTACEAAGFTAAVALLTVSFRKQQRWGASYPRVIDEAVQKQLNYFPFYRRNVVFTIALKDPPHGSDQWIDCATKYSFEAVNRSDGDRDYTIGYRLNSAEGRIVSFKIDGIPQETQKWTHAGFISHPEHIDRGASKKIEIDVHDRFRIIDTDFCTSYQPATDLRVAVTNGSSRSLDIEFDTLHVFPHKPEIDGTSEYVYIPEGILPYQGVRLRWRPKNNA